MKYFKLYRKLILTLAACVTIGAGILALLWNCLLYTSRQIC